jgi:hypothetical protein
MSGHVGIEPQSSHSPVSTVPENGTPPSIVTAELVAPTVLKGENGQVRWDIKGADCVTVTVHSDRPVAGKMVNWEDFPDGCDFPVTESGLVSIHAQNRHGISKSFIGDVVCYEPEVIGPLALPLSHIASASGHRSGKQRSAAAARLLLYATRILPTGDRARYIAELGSELSEIAWAGGGRRAQLIYAARQVLHAWQLRAELRAPRRRGAVE